MKMSQRLSDREYHEALTRPDARRAMELRCEETGHDFENGLTAAFRFVLVCKWCGERR
jgi:hypothetical protein